MNYWNLVVDTQHYMCNRVTHEWMETNLIVRISRLIRYDVVHNAQ